MTDVDDQRGIYRKFDVRRVDRSDETGGKHQGCEYFVLDLDHDPYALPALAAYAESCEVEYPLLAQDLRLLLTWFAMTDVQRIVQEALVRMGERARQAEQSSGATASQSPVAEDSEFASEFDDRERTRILAPHEGGRIAIDLMHDGRFDLGMRAPQGHSVALYLTRGEVNDLIVALGDALLTHGQFPAYADQRARPISTTSDSPQGVAPEDSEVVSELRAALAAAQAERDEAWQEAEHPFDKSEFDAMAARVAVAETALREVAVGAADRRRCRFIAHRALENISARAALGCEGGQHAGEAGDEC